MGPTPYFGDTHTPIHLRVHFLTIMSKSKSTKIAQSSCAKVCFRVRVIGRGHVVCDYMNRCVRLCISSADPNKLLGFPCGFHSKPPKRKCSVQRQTHVFHTHLIVKVSASLNNPSSAHWTGLTPWPRNLHRHRTMMMCNPKMVVSS